MKNITTNALDAQTQREAWLPVNIRETDDSYILTAEIPGAKREAVTVELEHDELSIEAQTEFPTNGKVLLSEFAPTRYRRSFHVGRLVDRDRIEARVENGLLELRLGKARDAKPQRIEIKSA